jgi:hypothetical protein
MDCLRAQLRHHPVHLGESLRPRLRRQVLGSRPREIADSDDLRTRGPAKRRQMVFRDVPGTNQSYPCLGLSHLHAPLR